MKKQAVVIITDAGLPAAETAALRLEQEGMTVIRNYPGGMKEKKHSGYEFDTASEAEMKELLELARNKAGNINALIHTDNWVLQSSIEKISEEEFKNCIDRNTKSAFFTSKVFGQHISEQGGGEIIFLSSLHDEKPTGCAFAYSTAKGAVKMLCKELALFYGRKGVRVNLIEMDCTSSEEKLFDSTLSPFNYDAVTKIPVRRRAEPEDFSGVIAFLLSEEAAFINGAEIRIDGGHLLYYRDR